MQRGQFTFYRSYFEAVSELNKRDATAVLMAVCAYALDEEEPALTGIAKAVFALMKPTLDAGRKRAEGGAKSTSAKETQKEIKGDSKGTQKELKGNSKGTQKKLKGNSKGTQKELEGNSKGTQEELKPNKKEKEGEREKENEKEEEIEKEGENECYTPSPVPQGGDVPSRGAEERGSFGTYGWVKLTQREHETLLAQLGEEELERCVTYVDESAQKTGNKNGWKDWALVVYACHRDRWGLRKPADPISDRTDYQPTARRIRENGQWLDRFLEERREKQPAPAGGEERHEN